MESLAKKSLLWITVVFLLFVLISAFRLGVAELFALSARQEMEGWGDANQPPSIEQVETVAHRFEIARFLSNGNPDHYEYLARLSLVRVTQAGMQPDVKRTQLLAGLTDIRTAIRLRPVSPYSWTILLLLKRDLHEYDAEFRFALHRAVELGPWEPQLLSLLADVGLSAWDTMPEEEQALVQQVFVRGMQRQAKQMGDVATAHRNPCAEKQAGCQ